jgi:hypothetical protein
MRGINSRRKKRWFFGSLTWAWICTELEAASDTYGVAVPKMF